MMSLSSAAQLDIRRSRPEALTARMQHNGPFMEGLDLPRSLGKAVPHFRRYHLAVMRHDLRQVGGLLQGAVDCDQFGLGFGSGNLAFHNGVS